MIQAYKILLKLRTSSLYCNQLQFSRKINDKILTTFQLILSKEISSDTLYICCKFCNLNIIFELTELFFTVFFGN